MNKGSMALSVLFLLLSFRAYGQQFIDFDDYVEATAQPFFTSPVIDSVVAGDMEALLASIAQGYDIDVQDDKGQTALYKAVIVGRDDMVRVLLYNGANATIVANNGFSPLSLAAQNGMDSIVESLLDRSYSFPADINYQVPQPYGTGWTPLHIAIIKKNDTTVELLLEKGANPYITTFDGMNALEFARFYNADTAAEIIEKYMM